MMVLLVRGVWDDGTGFIKYRLILIVVFLGYMNYLFIQFSCILLALYRFGMIVVWLGSG